MAANQGSSSALETLGHCYERGLGAERSPEKAFHYYSLAAEIDIQKGRSSSIFELGRCHQYGIGTEKSLEKAIYYYKLAGENGLLVGYSQAGYCYEKMGGIENQKKADAYFKMAKTTEVTRIESQLKDMKQTHHFKTSDRSQHLYQKLPDIFPSFDPPLSSRLVGGPEITKYKEAAAQGDVEAQYQMGLKLGVEVQWNNKST